MKTEMINNEGNILPSTAISIKVTNILTPYIIRILKQKDYKKKLNLINKKLMLLEKKGMLNIDVERVEPKIGNVVIVHDKLDKDLDLPAWLCRGIINSILDDMKNIYNVFLPDYGIAVELQRNDFCMSSTDLILDEYLTYTVGLYDILPAALKYNSPAQGESSLLVSEEWNALAIQYIKDLMVASSTIYFDHLASDERASPRCESSCIDTVFIIVQSVRSSFLVHGIFTKMMVTLFWINILTLELRNTNGTLQIIITAKHWTPQLKKMAAVLMDCPYMCIASFIEATIFKSVYPKMYIVNSKTKDRKLLDLLSNEFSKLRTVIICTNSAEAEKVHKFLKQSIKDILLAHEDMNLIHLQGIKQCWDACVSDSYPVLICTDEVLSDLDITNATWLIHYSISLRFKTQFNFRFSTLFDNLQEEKSTCKVTILVDENNDIQFLSIIEIMQRINVVIPQSLSENIEHIRTALEKKKDNYPLCNNIKLWGFCYKNHSCTLRHKIISELDAPIIDIRMKDKVKFRIISIHNVTQISARIISYIKFDTSEEIELSNVQYMEIIIKIQEFYSSVDNRRNCESIYVGCICGLEEPVDCYKRVQILHIDEEDEMDKPKYADVRCIDNGVILKKVNIYRLLHMPEELIKYPAQVVDVFLTDIAPHDDEYVWNRCAIDTVFQWFKDNVDGRSYVIGTVNLHLKNTIWVNTLEIGTKLIGYKDIVGSSLKTELIKNDHAVENPEHLQQMYQLCKDAGLLELNGYNLNVLMNK
ncbi:putative ATP-dependent RNA helicase TDRD12 isoform X5 [Nomia melanderi]|uniref:putative ATP-dependent RNA helicase TDRD12 isoform X5 n=1 Tax=Nomia melanderi TaxID=2448451 RepID=UPI001304579E|nr:putative ATP-dependent RNA helicase TDRD12 isoform X4 [Nomia melanderi]